MAEDHATPRHTLLVVGVAAFAALAGVGLSGGFGDGRLGPGTGEPAGRTYVLKAFRVADERALDVEYVSGGCIDPAGVTVDETAAEVRLTGQVRGSPGPGASCGAVEETARATVTLREPLGGRRVVDTLTGREVPVLDPVS